MATKNSKQKIWTILQIVVWIVLMISMFIEGSQKRWEIVETTTGAIYKEYSLPWYEIFKYMFVASIIYIISIIFIRQLEGKKSIVTFLILSVGVLLLSLSYTNILWYYLRNDLTQISMLMIAISIMTAITLNIIQFVKKRFNK